MENTESGAGSRLPGTPGPDLHFSGWKGLRIAADRWGSVGKDLVVLLHGRGQTRHAWRRTGQALADAGFIAVAFDARGHGDSAWAQDGDYSWDAMVGDLQAVVRGMKARSVVLVGSSMGGGICLIAAGEAKVDPRALVLVEAAPKVEAAGVDGVFSFMARSPEGFGSLEEAADAVASYQPGRARADILRGLGRNVRQGGDSRFRWHWDPRMMFGREDLAVREARMRQCALRLKAPSLLVRGADSTVVSEDGARDYLSLARNSEYLRIEGEGHMVVGQRNDAFGRAVLEFLDRTCRRSSPDPATGTAQLSGARQ